MPRHTTVKYPKDQLQAVVRAWFLEVIRTDCPEVLDDLWKNVFVPFRKFLSPTSVGTPLKPRGSQAEDVIRGSQHRRVFAAIFRWARRWNLNAPWICNQARRTLLFWAKYPRLVKSIPVRSKDHAASPGPVGGQVREWGAKINAGLIPGGRTGDEVRRPRDDVHFVWFVRNRVCGPPTPHKELAAGAAATNRHVDIDTVRIALNRLAPTLDLPVRPRGRPRKKLSRPPQSPSRSRWS